jgi:hypothetical protein
LAVIAALSISVFGCGGEDDPQRPPRAAAKSPDAATCGELRSDEARRRVAERVADRLVAPEGQSRQVTVRMVINALRLTCSQPQLPGAGKARDYRPVPPVLKALQAELDEEEIFHE